MNEMFANIRNAEEGLKQACCDLVFISELGAVVMIVNFIVFWLATR
jgi:hypothetical protein